MERPTITRHRSRHLAYEFQGKVVAMVIGSLGRMDRRKKLMSSLGEVKTREALQRAARQFDVRVESKTRLGDALDLSKSGLTDELFSYATRAHLDFVITDKASLPLFAVEFDGAQHSTDQRTIERDRMKNEVCERLGLPLLRIRKEFLSERREFTIVGWLVTAYLLEREWEAMKARGEVDTDEPFTYFSVQFVDDAGKRRSFSFEGQADAQMHAAFRAGLSPSFLCERVFKGVPSRVSIAEALEAFCLFELVDQRFLVGHATLSNFGRFGGVAAWELARDLATADCGDRIAAFRRGDLVPWPLEQLAELRQRTRGWTRDGIACSDFPFGS